VVVYFSAQVMLFASDNNAMYVQVLLDGSAAGALPVETIFAHSKFWQTNAASFIFPSVAPGAHSIRMRYLSENPPNRAFVGPSNMIVNFAP
jgi:hypothetical protein